MSDKKQIAIISIIVTISVFIGTTLSNFAFKKQPSFGNANAPTLIKSATNSNASVLITNTAILANRTSRVHAVIVNDGAYPVYLGFGVAAVANKGVRLNPQGGTYEINEQNLFIGAINGIAVGGTSIVTTLEE